MAYRYQGKADRFDRKHGKLRRQVDADTRKAESKVRNCGHAHTDNGSWGCRDQTARKIIRSGR